MLKCKFCKKYFRKLYDNATNVCSQDCYFALKSKEARGTTKDRRCESCDKIFTTKYPKQIKCCSYDCETIMRGKEQGLKWIKAGEWDKIKNGPKMRKVRIGISSRWSKQMHPRGVDLKPKYTKSLKIKKNEDY